MQNTHMYVASLLPQASNLTSLLQASALVSVSSMIPPVHLRVVVLPRQSRSPSSSSVVVLPPAVRERPPVPSQSRPPSPIRLRGVLALLDVVDLTSRRPYHHPAFATPLAPVALAFLGAGAEDTGVAAARRRSVGGIVELRTRRREGPCHKGMGRACNLD